jgi:hypothetical protein
LPSYSLSLGSVETSSPGVGAKTPLPHTCSQSYHGGAVAVDSSNERIIIHSIRSILSGRLTFFIGIELY